MGVLSRLAFRPSPKFLMSFFIFANFFNYLDRGIIPGAASEFDGVALLAFPKLTLVNVR
jgi:hypothetical protein